MNIRHTQEKVAHTHESHSDDKSNEEMAKQNQKMHPQGLLRILARILTLTLARTLMAATVLPHARLMWQSGNKWIFPKSMAIECSLEKQNHQECA